MSPARKSRALFLIWKMPTMASSWNGTLMISRMSSALASPLIRWNVAGIAAPGPP